MQTPPENLDIQTISAALSAYWQMDAAALTYAPVGYGSHHWIVETGDGVPWFITVYDLHSAYSGENAERSFEALDVACETAAALRDDAGLGFVVGPIVHANRAWIHRLNERYAMAVFPHLDVEPTEYGAFQHESDRNDAMRLIGAVHNVTPQLAVDRLRAETFVVPKRAELLQTLSELDVSWKAGPFAEPARRLLRDHAAAVHERLRRFDRLAAHVLADRSGWVVSHGEPHTGNIIRTRSGRMVVVDWDTMAYAPPERDLWMLLDDNPDWSAYREMTNLASLSEHALAACRDRWMLADIAMFVSMCRGPHDRTEAMEMVWAELHAFVTEPTRPVFPRS